MRHLTDGLIQKYDFLSNVPWILIYLVIALISCLVILGFIAVLVMFLTWLERKVASHIQDRLGPMRVGGWHGWAQPIADAIKLFLKEDIISALADRRLFILAPLLVFVSAFAVYVALPFGDGLIVSDLNIGIFYILAISSLGVIGIIMAGWSSNNKWSLLGAMRSAAQIVSYEIPVGLSLLTVIMMVGSLSMQEIVRSQSGGIHHWFIFRNPFAFIAFFIYFIASLSEVNRTPFDIPEAESELVAGYHTEYTGMRFAFFFMAEYANMFTVSAIAATLFLGGWQAPWGDPGSIFDSTFLGTILGFIFFVGKALLLVSVQMWLRWTLPRLRVDQLMHVCWKVLTPFAFANLAGMGIWMFAFGQV